MRFKATISHGPHTEKSSCTKGRNEKVHYYCYNWKTPRKPKPIRFAPLHASPWQELPIKAHSLLAKQKILSGLFKNLFKSSTYYPQECHLPAWNTPVCLTCCLQGESIIEKGLPDRQLGNHSWTAGEAESQHTLSPASHCCQHGSCQYCFLLEAVYSIILLLGKDNVNLTIKLGT